MAENKYKYLAKNMGLLTVSNFGSKLLSFFLVPLYTSVLTTAEYGTYDLLNTTISLMIPILSVSIIDAMLRFCLDKDADHQAILTTALSVIVKGSVVFWIIIFANYFLGIFNILNDYLGVFILLYFSMLLFQLLQSFARGIDDVLGLAISGIVNSIVMLSLNIFFLLYIKLGLTGYFLANIISHVVSALYLSFRLKIWRYIKLNKISRSLEKEMTNYSKPLIVNSISWWVNNASDRYIVTWLCGVAVNGVYSVGYKIPSILSVVQTIFNQAWQLSSVNAYNADDSDGFFKNIYNVYNLVMVFGCSLIIILTRFIARLLYANDFYDAWIYVPFLMIAIVFGSLSGVLGGVFQAVKDSKIQSRSTAIGAIANVVMNITFVYFWGAIGAAIATSISYAIVWAMRLNHVRRYMSLNINLKRDSFAYILLVLQTILMLLNGDSVLLYLGECFIAVIILLIYNEEVVLIVRKLLSGIKK